MELPPLVSVGCGLAQRRGMMRWLCRSLEHAFVALLEITELQFALKGPLRRDVARDALSKIKQLSEVCNVHASVYPELLIAVLSPVCWMCPSLEGWCFGLNGPKHSR